MNKLVIYGAYAEGFILKGSAELSPVEPCSSILDVKEAYAYIGIDITGGILNLNNGTGFAPGFIVGDVTYLHFQAGHVPDDILIREA